MRIETTEQKCARLEVENAAQSAEIKILKQKLDAVIKLLYGAKSEKIDPAQLQLLLEGLETKKRKRLKHHPPSVLG